MKFQIVYKKSLQKYYFNLVLENKKLSFLNFTTT